MTTETYLKQFLPANQSLTDVARELFVDTPLPTDEQVNNALAEGLRAFITTISDSCLSRPEGYPITDQSGNIDPDFFDGLLMRLTTNLRMVAVYNEDQAARMKLLLIEELKRLAALPDLTLPRGRLAIDDQGSLRIFSESSKPQPTTNKPLWNKAVRSGRFMRVIPD